MKPFHGNRQAFRSNQKAREKAIEIAKSLLEDGTEIVKIMKATGLMEEELLNLL